MKKTLLSLSLSLIFSLLLVLPALADDPIVGEIRLWPNGNPPAGWLICDGSTLSVAAYPQLHQTIYWVYGGYTGAEDQFKIPDFRGRGPMGRDASQSEFDGWGESGGEKKHTLTVNEIPSHTHIQNPHGHNLPYSGTGLNGYASYKLAAGIEGSTGIEVTTAVNQNTGGGQSHNVLDPYLTINFIIYTGVGLPTPTPTPTNTPSPTPTNTPTPTATPIGGSGVPTDTTYLPQIYGSTYTTTLASGKTLTQAVQVSFGEIIMATLVLATVSLVALQLVFGVVFKR